MDVYATVYKSDEVQLKVEVARFPLGNWSPDLGFKQPKMTMYWLWEIAFRDRVDLDISSRSLMAAGYKKEIDPINITIDFIENTITVNELLVYWVEYETK